MTWIWRRHANAVHRRGCADTMNAGGGELEVRSDASAHPQRTHAQYVHKRKFLGSLLGFY